MKKRELKEQSKKRELEIRKEEKEKAKKDVEGALTKELLRDISVEDKLDLVKMISNEIKSSTESHYKKLSDLLMLCEDNNDQIIKSALKNITEVFCDVLPSYKIREEEEKE